MGAGLRRMSFDGHGVAPIASLHWAVEREAGAHDPGDPAEAVQQLLVETGEALWRIAGQIGIHIHDEPAASLKAELLIFKATKALRGQTGSD